MAYFTAWSCVPLTIALSTARGPGGRVPDGLELSPRCQAALRNWVAMETAVIAQSVLLPKNRRREWG